jgi:hypothetical protein
MNNDFMSVSRTPMADLQELSFEGQHPNRRGYKEGYERYLEAIPRLIDNDPSLANKLATARKVFNLLFDDLKQAEWFDAIPLEDGDFTRVFLAMEPRELNESGEPIPTTELLVTRWSKGMQVPPHSHAAGFMHESMIRGQFVETEYRLVDDGLLRPIHTVVFNSGDTISDVYTKPQPGMNFPALIHSVDVTEESLALHLVPDHPRDGRGNMRYEVQHFATWYNLTPADLYKVRRSTDEPKVGDVYLVKDLMVAPYLKAHYSIIKAVYEDGYSFITVTAPDTEHLLKRELAKEDGSNALLASLTLGIPFENIVESNFLKLSPVATEAFLRFHNYQLQCKEGKPVGIKIPNHTI